ncbi:hypothetical protein [Streptomyces subrutilus]|uniref:Uncharacterized protein n=1 Tax=Streptomyces subrutilus TaxID=36818 RepID=A0A1E5Q0I5_9ACTN|nr:hypothetical protein [Streptomyces subrutilus]OEJ35236.1 hypothetical protein BGK67_31535 [Streptomyces subrutilus]
MTGSAYDGPSFVGPHRPANLHCAALRLLGGSLLREDITVDVRVDGGEDQAPELVRLRCLSLPLDGALDVEAVAAGEGRPSRVAALSSVAGSPYACVCS